MSNDEILISLKEKILSLKKENGRLQAKVNFYVNQTIDQFKEIKNLRNQKKILIDLLPPDKRSQILELERLHEEFFDATPPKDPTLTPPAPFDAPCL